MNLRLWSGTAALGCAFSFVSAAGQPVRPETTVGDALRSLGSRAHDIFAGQVTAIRHRGGVVEISFRIDQPIAGSQGGVYTLREWAGLWTGGQQRFWVGERALVFLNPTGAAGLSSPVDGAEGVLPLMVQGPAAPALVDVRRLAARVQRRVVDPMEGEDTGALTLEDAAAAASSLHNPVWREPRRRPIPAAFRPARFTPTRVRMLDGDAAVAGREMQVDLQTPSRSIRPTTGVRPVTRSGGPDVR